MGTINLLMGTMFSVMVPIFRGFNRITLYRPGKQATPEAYSL